MTLVKAQIQILTVRKNQLCFLPSVVQLLHVTAGQKHRAGTIGPDLACNVISVDQRRY
jgi:hypothetical protein